MNKYSFGFRLHTVKCANCAFNNDSVEYETEEIIYPLKEQLCENLEILHDEDVQIQKGIYKCKGRKLSISFVNVGTELL
jgi:hypothetical protein